MNSLTEQLQPVTVPVPGRHARTNLLMTMRQGGLVLLLSLAVLAGLSLLALIAASSMLQQRQMSANYTDGELARLSAMTAVRAGEKFIFNLDYESRVESCQSGCYVEPAHSMILQSGQLPDHPEFLPDDWWLQWGHPLHSQSESGFTTGQPDLAASLPGRLPPLFIIQELEFLTATGSQAEADIPAISGIAYYQVLGRGTGVSAGNTHVAESILARPWLTSSGQEGSLASDCGAFEAAIDCGRLAYRERR
ncbi:MAG TPA: hypothetical protein VFG52_00535 [Xanthomonadales bacterium]|nr:hypothetical protein [Xanthomonadales bacterium]